MNQANVDYILGLKGKTSDTGIRKEIQRVFKVKKSQGNDLFRRLFPAENVTGDKEAVPTRQQAKATYGGDEGVAESVDDNVRTLDELLSVCAVDLETWYVEKYVVNKWEVAFSDKQNAPLFQVKAWLARKKEAVDSRAILAEFVKRAEEKAPPITAFKFARTTVSPDSERLLEISIPDFHLSKLCWSKETGGEDWDIKLAPEAYKSAAYGLLQMAKSAKPTRILLPIGNDFFNSDNLKGETTAGTAQATSEDSRWQKTFDTGQELLNEVIETLATEYPVDIVVVPGNHDFERSYYLGATIKAWFRNHPNVTVNNSPKQRKYVVFGQNLLGFTHGNEEKHEKLPMLMANEMKEAWAATKFRHVHLGHFHHEIVKEYSGVKVSVVPSLVPADSWHTQKGLTGNIRGAQGFLYDSANGLIATYYHNA